MAAKTTDRTERGHHAIKATNLTTEERAFLEEHGGGLSDSTLRARWIHEPGERAEHDGQTLATRSRAVIEAWAAERDGRAATVPGTEHGDRAGVLRIVFGDGDHGRLEEIPWDEWFRTFEVRELVFLFQDRKADGAQSTFFRLDSPEREDG
jgi:hypothetical protein